MNDKEKKSALDEADEIAKKTQNNLEFEDDHSAGIFLDFGD